VRTHLLRPGLAALSISLWLALPPAVRAGELTYRLTTGAGRVTVERADAGDRIVAAGPGYVQVTEPGMPVLPYRVVSLILPPGETLASYDVEASAGVAVAHDVRPDIAPEATATDGSRANGPATTAWGAGETYPSARAVFLGTGYLHGYAIASFALFPVRLEAGAVLVSEALDLRVVTETGAQGVRVARRARARDGAREETARLLGQYVVNPEMASSYPADEVRVASPRGGFQPTSLPSFEGSDVDYVIITNDSLAATFQVLADWKTAKGVRTVVRTTEWINPNYRQGADPAETIRSFILDAYQKWGIRYALLGGDTDQIPARIGASYFLGNKHIPADMYYGCLDGDWNADHDEFFGEAGAVDQTDLYQEVYIGRLPATSNAAAAVLIGKVVSYETPVDPAYTGSALLLAEVLFPIDWSYGQTVTQDGAAIAEFLYMLALDGPSLTVAKHYENYTAYPGSLPENAASTIAEMNLGYDHVNHTGHGFRFNMSVGSENVVNSDADALVNTDRYSNLFLLNCTAVAYTYFCLGEHFLLNPNGGAVSVLGAAESVYPGVAQPYMNEYYDLVFNDGVVNVGEAYARSKLPRTPIAQQGDNADLWTHYVFSILADPEMPLWTAPVEPLIVTHPASIATGTTAITVHVGDALGPIQDARVCLSKDDDDYEVGLTNAAGNVTLTMTAESAGEVRVVATAFNRARYDAGIAVTAPATARIMFASATVDDDSSATTSGNGDGVIDAGEVVELKVAVTNTGSLGAQNVTLALHSLSGGVTVLDSLASVGAVPAGGTATASSPFRVAIVSSFADEAPVKLGLSARENGIPSGSDSFIRLVHAPQIEFVVLRVDDAGTGNGDGVVQANEDFRLHYEIKNFGTGAAYGLAGSLVDVSGAFVFTDSVDAYDELATAAGAENADGFLIRETDVATAHNVRLDVTDAYGRTWQKVFELRPPAAPAAPAFDASLGPDRLLVTWDPPAEATDVNRYRVMRSFGPGGPYTVATVDPVYHTVFLDRGLQPTTRYYYRISALDASGNESALSVEKSGSTNPTQVQGWPIAMTTETVSSPAVGDIDGDWDYELVQGDNKVYAWHDDGVEVRDADGNAQTWGLFSMLGSSFISHVALAEIDTVPGLDILAASRDTREVYAFNYTGSVIAGWPRPVQWPIRAAIVAGDIDGDEQKEVIAIDEKGVMYVWRADGTEFRDGDHNPATAGVFRSFGGCSYQYTCPALGDLDGDSLNEIIVGTQGDSVFVLNADGTSMAGWPMAFSSDISGSIAVGDIDNNGDLELVVCEWGGNTWALNHDGATMWYRYFPNALGFAPSPALGDLDGDGRLETVLPSKNRYLFAVKWNGGDLAGWPVVYASQLWTESSPVIADIDRDGSLDVVLGDENRYINGWTATGQPLAGFPLATGDAVRATPVIADLDKDGDVEVIAAGWDKSVYVWDFPEMFNPRMAPWPKYHANLYNDGNIDTPVPTPVREAAFAFSIRDAGVELVWQVGPEAGAVFDVDRAEVVDGTPGRYANVAEGLGVGADGTVRFVDRGVEMGSRYSFRLVADGGVVHETAGLYIPVSRAVLGQNYPNPFNPVTRIDYWVPETKGEGARAPVNLSVYDVRGARVRTLVDGPHAAGRYRVEWDGRDERGVRVGSGVYFYRMSTPRFSDSRKMVLLK
jgi:hypothetical protein